jgi:signal transduction histidine kinase
MKRDRRSTTKHPSPPWTDFIGIAAMAGVAVFVAARLGIALPTKTDFISVFWPAFGLGTGILISAGPYARWPVVSAVTVANFAAHASSGEPLWVGGLGIAEGVQTLVTAALVERYFGADFSLGRLRHVLGLLAAATAGSVLAWLWWMIPATLFQHSTGSILSSLQQFCMSDMVGFIATGPFVIGVFTVLRQRPQRRELIEGTVALIAVGLVTGVILWLPRRLWETALPIAWLFPILLWLTARFRPPFAAAAGFVVSITVVWTTVFGIGHFGDPALALGDRILQAQTAIIFVALGALVLAALFDERRLSAMRLQQSNVALERERDNKLMNIEAIAGAIVHELRQPLFAIATNDEAALALLERTPPDLQELRAALTDIGSDAKRAADVMEGIRNLVRNTSGVRQSIDINEVIHWSMNSLHSKFSEVGIKAKRELASGLPLIDGDRTQLQEVMINLIHNALEAMEGTQIQFRSLILRTGLNSSESVTVSIEDTGPGIDPKNLAAIFDPFVSTKEQGRGLGLAICRSIVESHGGRLSASSDGSAGAMFNVVLPIKASAALQVPR